MKTQGLKSFGVTVGKQPNKVEESSKTNPFTTMMEHNKATGPKGSDFKFDAVAIERPPELEKLSKEPAKKDDI